MINLQSYMLQDISSGIPGVKPFRRLLLNLVVKETVQRFAEVGVNDGATMFFLLEHANTISMYAAIDSWTPYDTGGYDRLTGLPAEEFERRYGAVMALSGKYPAARIMRLPSVAAAKEFPDRFFDMVFIDACHEYRSVISDISAWVGKVRPGGILCGHDYEKGWQDHVIKAHDEIFCHPANPLFTVWAERIWRLP